VIDPQQDYGNLTQENNLKPVTKYREWRSTGLIWPFD